MTRKSSPRWGSQLLMWSSPLLLLVMLFSMTASARTTTTTTRVGAPGSLETHPTTTFAQRATTTTRKPSPPTTSTTTKAPTSHATRSVAAIASNVNSAVFVPGASAVNGSSSGVVRSGAVVDVPLRGPGAWTLSASAPVTSHLACPQANTSFANQIVIDNAQTCQLTIIATGPTTSSWQLTAQP